MHKTLKPEEWESWNALLMLNRSVLQALDTELRREHGLAVTEFDVLITLYNAPNKRLGMSALADRVLLSPAGTTHLVTRLERGGMVRREADEGDGRKRFTVLTDRGSEALGTARPTHDNALRRSVLGITTATERRTLQRLWKRLSQQQRPGAGS